MLIMIKKFVHSLLKSLRQNPDTTFAQMSVANKPEFVKEFKENQVILVGELFCLMKT
jgi:hypothetical protein